MRVDDLRPVGELTKALAAVREAEEQQAPRAPGLHLSQIVDDISLSLGWHTEDEERRLGPAEVFWDFGIAWEARVVDGLRRRHGGGKPEPATVDGVTCSADFLREAAVDEIKLGWISSRQGVEHPKIRKFVCQLMGYMYAYEREVGYLHVGYVKGNYADKLVDLGSWRLVREERELRKHWRWLLQHAEDRGWR